MVLEPNCGLNSRLATIYAVRDIDYQSIPLALQGWPTLGVLPLACNRPNLLSNFSLIVYEKLSAVNNYFYAINSDVISTSY